MILIVFQQWLLTRIWLSRKKLTSLSQDVIVQLGRRLVEVRFFHGHVDSAIELGEDIFYNLQRVYGTSHPSTVDIASFLSSMYEATGDGAAAMAVIGDGSQLKLPDMKKPKAEVHPPRATEGGKSKLEYLLQFYQRNDNMGKSFSQSAANAKGLTYGDGTSSNRKGLDSTMQRAPTSWGFIN